MNQTQGQTAPIITDLQGYYAGFISRVLAFIIDAIIIALTITVFNWIVWVTLDTLSTGIFLGISANKIPGVGPVIDFLRDSFLIGFLSALFILLYHVFFTYFAGQTPGKALLGLRVVAVEGKRVSVVRSLLRYLGYFVSAAPLFIGFFWVLIDDQRQGWHDKIARTYVIYTWEARPDERFLSKELYILSSHHRRGSSQ